MKKILILAMSCNQDFFKREEDLCRQTWIKNISCFDNIDYYNVLSMRYVSRDTFEYIAEKTNWSIRKVFTLHGKALLDFETRYGKEYL